MSYTDKNGSSKVCSIHQPVFMPYLGVIDKIWNSDTFVALDDVQYVRRGYVNRNKILTQDGVQWLTIPVKKMTRDALISEIEIDFSVDWQNKMYHTIQHAYSKAPYYAEVMEVIGQLFTTKHSVLSSVNMDLLKNILAYLGIHAPFSFVYSSEFPVIDDPSSRLADRTLRSGSSVYLSGENGREYLDLSKMGGVEVRYNEYTCKEYPQYNSKEFVPYLSVLDFLMNMGYNKDRL